MYVANFHHSQSNVKNKNLRVMGKIKGFVFMMTDKKQAR